MSILTPFHSPDSTAVPETPMLRLVRPHISTMLVLLTLTNCTSISDSTGTLQSVVFDVTTSLTGNAELLRRSLDKVAAAKVYDQLARTDHRLAEQAIQPQLEEFQVFVPRQKPKGGYALLVFVSPANDATVPRDWLRVLSQFGVICVTPAGAGNDANVIGRREPLALIAEQNAVRKFSIDAHYVWIAGFSGGSRVAMRLALAYPDVFTGVILNAGSDPIGKGGIPLPPADLAIRFQTQTRVLYVTGELDSFHLNADVTSLQSMMAYCVKNTNSIVLPGIGHTLMDGAALSQALGVLMEPLPISNEVTTCNG